MAGTHDPAVPPEEEGIPDLQDGTPQQQRASDPQQMPIPGDEPVAADAFGTTVNEQREGMPLDDRLAAEEPDVGEEPAVPGEPNLLAEPEVGGEDDLRRGAGEPDEEAGLLADDPYPGRPRNQDVFSHTDETEGLSAEEAAVHVADEQDRTR